MRNALLLDEPANRSAASVLADELITASHAHPSDKIIIAGANQLELLLACCRRGLLSATCLSAVHGPGLQTNKADVLIAPVNNGEADLPSLLRCFGRALRPGGVLVIHSTAAAARHNQPNFLLMLLNAGFVAVERVARRNNGGELWLARKQLKISAQAA